MAVERISRTVEEVLASAGLTAVALQVSLRRSWKRIAGPFLAAKTHPVRIRNGVLTVHVPTASWAQELQLSKPVLLGKIGSVLGDGRIRDIRFAVGPLPSAEEEPSSGGTSARRPPLLLPGEIEEIRDPETRELIRSICRKSARRKE